MQDTQNLVGMLPVPGSSHLGVEGGEKGRGFWKDARSPAGYTDGAVNFGRGHLLAG